MILKISYVRMELPKTGCQDGQNCIAFVMHLCWMPLMGAQKPSTTTLTILRMPLVFALILKMILNSSYVTIEFSNMRCCAESCTACFMNLRWITVVATHKHTHAQTHANSALQTHMHACIHADMHACMHTCIHAYMHTCIHAYTHAYMHKCMNTYTHPYMHS